VQVPLLALAGALLLATAATAQEAPASARMDLWCGTAFKVMTTGAPAGATPEQTAAAKTYADAGARLIDRAVPVYLESGYTDDALAELRDEIEKTVRAGLDGTGDPEPPAYSFEDCASLIDKGKEGQ
jgi:hypothetical protein